MAFDTNPQEGVNNGDDELAYPDVSFEFDKTISNLPLNEIFPGNEIQISTGEAVEKQKQFDIQITSVNPETGLIRGAISTYSGKAEKARYYDFELLGCFDIEYKIDDPEESGSAGGPVIVKCPGELKKDKFIHGRLVGDIDEGGR